MRDPMQALIDGAPLTTVEAAAFRARLLARS